MQWLFYCVGWSVVNTDGTVVNTRSDQSVLVLLKLPIVCIMGLCLISGAASITFIESTLSLYLDKQVSKTETFQKIFMGKLSQV